MRTPVDGTGNKLFARPGFACHQNTGVRGRDFRYQRQYPLQRRRGSNDFVAYGRLSDSFAQSDTLVLQSLLRLLWICDVYSDACHDLPPNLEPCTLATPLCSLRAFWNQFRLRTTPVGGVVHTKSDLVDYPFKVWADYR